MGNDSVNRTGQEAPFPTVVVRPEDPLNFSIAQVLFDEVTGIPDVSRIPEFFYQRLAEKLFSMFHRKPEEHPECFEATVCQLRKPCVLVGNLWGE